MRIAIDITPLTTLHQRRGIGWYTKYLIDALKKYERNNSYIFFTREDKVPKNVDLVHYTYFDHFFSTLPWRRSAKTVITIHDLTPIKFLSDFNPGIQGKLNWQLQKWKAKRVEAIICDSYTSKTDVIKYINIPSERINVVYLAASRAFRQINDKKFLTSIRKKYEFFGNFLLYVGDINFNKNIKTLLSAFSLLLEIYQDIKLALVGEAFLGSSIEADEIDKEVSRLNLHDNVRRLGFVPMKDLVGLYNLASVYVQPSLYEGFGLPVIEAMACGCPVVVTKDGALPEIAEQAVIYVQAKSPQSIAFGIKKVFSMKSKERSILIKNGFKQAAKYSWKKTAQNTIKVYQKVVNQ